MGALLRFDPAFSRPSYQETHNDARFIGSEKGRLLALCCAADNLLDESGRDGLILHEAVRQAVATSLKTSDPSRDRALRRSAWRYLVTSARDVHGPALWGSTADILYLYLLENPAVREGFFPSDVLLYSVEPSRSEDAKAILAIVRKHEGREGAQALAAWWHALPTCFRVVRGPDTDVAGFYVGVDAEAVPPSLLRADPVVRRWAAVPRKDPVPRGQRMLFLRRWLSVNSRVPGPGRLLARHQAPVHGASPASAANCDHGA